MSSWTYSTMILCKNCEYGEPVWGPDGTGIECGFWPYDVHEPDFYCGYAEPKKTKCDMGPDWIKAHQRGAAT